MRVSTYQNRKGEDRVGLQLTLREAATLADAIPDTRVSLTFSPEQASELAGKANGEVRKAFAEAGVKARKPSA